MLNISKKIDKHITVQEEFYGKEADAVCRALRMIKGNYILKIEEDLNYGKIRKTERINQEEYNEFKNKYLNQPITLLTEENLEKLEKHCKKAIHYERGNEHQITLELIQSYKESEKENQELKEDIELIYKVKIENRNKLLDDSIQKSVIRQKIQEKCKALQHRTHIEEILENELNKLKKELLEDK